MNRNDFDIFLELEIGQLLDQLQDNVEVLLNTKDRTKSLVPLKMDYMRISWLRTIKQIDHLNIQVTDAQRKELSKTYSAFKT
jgi:hypothetical protein